MTTPAITRDETFPCGCRLVQYDNRTGVRVPCAAHAVRDLKDSLERSLARLHREAEKAADALEDVARAIRAAEIAADERSIERRWMRLKLRVRRWFRRSRT